MTQKPHPKPNGNSKPKKRSNPDALFTATMAKKGAIGFGIFVGGVAILFSALKVAFERIPFQVLAPVTRAQLAYQFRTLIEGEELPDTINLSTWSGVKTLTPRYTIDDRYQAYADNLLQQYKPDFSALVAIEAETGRVVAMSSFSRTQHYFGSLTLKAVFPAASVFKVVTATSAIDAHSLTPDSVITFRGGNHTLYKRNLSENGKNQWLRQMSLRDAFAKSINTVFGKLAAFIVKPEELLTYAERYRFNKSLAADFPVQTGRFDISNADSFAMAELGSGFNRIVQISPVQGALFAAAIVNDGKLMAPYLVDSLKDDKGELIYEGHPFPLADVMSKASSEHMRTLMRETVVRGTSRKAFRDWIRKPKANEVEIGGKTGSLKDEILRGKCDWFVGYGIRGNRKLAVAVLTVHENVWRVKSSTVARLFLEKYLDTAMDRSLMAPEEEGGEEEEDTSAPVNQAVGQDTVRAPGSVPSAPTAPTPSAAEAAGITLEGQSNSPNE